MFAVGSEVSYRGMNMPAEVISGPHPSPGRNRYLIKKADGNVSLVSETDLTRAIPRLDQVADAIAVEVYGLRLSVLPVGYQFSAKRAAAQVIAVADETRGQK